MATMTTLGEDAEAFFRTGDEGTYEGGPASDAPFALCDELEEELTVGVTDEQLERRRRLKRVVATIVGTLGTGLLLLFAWLLAVSAHATPVETMRASARPTPPPKAPPVAIVPLQPAVTPTSQPAVLAPQPAPASSSPAIATAPAETPTEERLSEPALPAVTPARYTSARRPPRPQAVAPTGRNIPRASASFASTGPSRHGPPTASFPD